MRIRSAQLKLFSAPLTSAAGGVQRKFWNCIGPENITYRSVTVWQLEQQRKRAAYKWCVLRTVQQSETEGGTSTATVVMTARSETALAVVWLNQPRKWCLTHPEALRGTCTYNWHTLYLNFPPISVRLNLSISIPVTTEMLDSMFEIHFLSAGLTYGPKNRST